VRGNLHSSRLLIVSERSIRVEAGGAAGGVEEEDTHAAEKTKATGSRFREARSRSATATDRENELMSLRRAGRGAA